MLRRLRGWLGMHPADAVLSLQALSPELVERAIAVFGEGKHSDDQIETEMLALAGDPMTARRLLDVVPEAFGLLLIAHIPACAEVVLPDGFQAQAADGRWHVFPWEREPLFALAAQVAARMFHEGPRARFQSIAMRSSMIAAVNNALNQERARRPSSACRPSSISAHSP